MKSFIEFVVSFAIGYAVISVLFALINLAQFLRCLYYHAKYKRNLKNHRMDRNAYIQDDIQDLCKSADIRMLRSFDIAWLSYESDASDIDLMFSRMRGRFLHRATHPWKWFPVVSYKIDKNTSLAKFWKVVISVFGNLANTFCSTFLGHLLSNTDTGKEILNKILSFLNL